MISGEVERGRRYTKLHPVAKHADQHGVNVDSTGLIPVQHTHAAAKLFPFVFSHRGTRRDTNREEISRRPALSDGSDHEPGRRGDRTRGSHSESSTSDTHRAARRRGSAKAHSTASPVEWPRSYCLAPTVVNSKGEPVDVNFNRSPMPAPVVEYDPPPIGVNFVR